MFFKLARLIIIVFLLHTVCLAQQATPGALLAKWHNLQSRQQLPPDTDKVNLLNAIADVYLHQVSDSCFWFANKALTMAAELHYDIAQAQACSIMAKMYYKKGDYTLSLKMILQSLAIADRINDRAGQANAYNVLGLVYQALDQGATGLEEFKKAAALNKAINDRSRLSANYVNISLAYSESNQLDSAIVYAKKAEIISGQVQSYEVHAQAVNHLGEYFFKIGQTDKAIAYFNAIVNNKTFQNEWENSFAYTGLANCYYKKGNYPQAVACGTKAFVLAKKTQTKWDIERATNILYQSYDALGDKKQAFNYLLLDKLYSDSLFNENRLKEINSLRLKQKQAENLVLVKKEQITRQQGKIDRMIILIVGIIAVFLVFVALLMYRNGIKKNALNKALLNQAADITQKNELIVRQNTELNQLNLAKDQIFSVIGHDLRSPFASILGTLALFRSGDFDEDEKELVLNQFFEQVTVTSNMLENLLLWANSQQGGIVPKFTEVSLPDIANQVLLVFGSIATEKNISIAHTPLTEAVILADQDQLRIILQNLIANAIKFTRVNGHIAITYQIQAASVKVAISDNGIGMPQTKVAQLFNLSGKSVSTYGTNNEKGIGLGLMLVKQFVDMNHGKITVISQENQGTEFILEFSRYQA